ncbi:mucin-17-like [Osmerus mordax]|uniref:mucin-17-like n=1 Tax=Osmerus mordax TaxID=8014 RepID=UPI0035105C03
MQIYYITRIQNFKSVNVTNLSRPATRRRRSATQDGLSDKIEDGALNYVRTENNGVRVEHNVVLEVNNSAQAETEFNTLFEQVQTAVKDVKSCSDVTPVTVGCPGFNITSTEPPEKEDLDLTAVCKDSVSNPEHAEHYLAVNMSGILKCVNKCDPGHPDPFTCDNDGTCAFSADEGAQCYCLHTGSTWYMGANCNHPINKIGFYVGMSVTGLVLVVLVGVLTAYLLLTKQRQRRNKDVKEQIVNDWLEDDFEWPLPRRPAGPYEGANNTTFEEEVNVYQQSGGSLTTETSQQGARYPESSSSAQPPLNPYNFNNQPIRIQRPQIKTTSEV